MPSKRELDKANMFRKIMPSSAAAAQGTPHPAAHTAPAPEAVPPPVSAAADIPAAPPAAQAAEAAPREHPPKSADIRPVNLAEILLTQCYPRYRERINGCECERCRDDALGMALNRIRPRYVPATQVRPADLADRELVSESVSALVRALFIIKRGPRHGDTGAG